MDGPLDVPTLATRDGSTLRPWRLADLGLVREASKDGYIPSITTVPSPFSEAEGAAFVARQWARVTSGTGYPFVIVDPAGRPVGSVGLWPKDHGPTRASLGYWIVESARGRGAATAALETVADWALRDLRVSRLELSVEPWNAASVRTAERAGFRREGRGRRQIGAARRDVLLFSRRDDDP